MYELDLGDSWVTDSEAYGTLLARLAPRRRVVLLSGDIHLAAAARMRYRGAQNAVFVQLISSGMLNESRVKLRSHRGGYDYPWPEGERPPVCTGRTHAGGESEGAAYAIEYQRSDREYPDGREIVGRNNLGEVSFARDGARLLVTQKVHWRERPELPTGPHTVFTVELGT
jgi:hypothetical protein